jgi:hypothetical protein
MIHALVLGTTSYSFDITYLVVLFQKFSRYMYVLHSDDFQTVNIAVSLYCSLLLR